MKAENRAIANQVLRPDCGMISAWNVRLRRSLGGASGTCIFKSSTSSKILTVLTVKIFELVELLTRPS